MAIAIIEDSSHDVRVPFEAGSEDSWNECPAYSQEVPCQLMLSLHCQDFSPDDVE
jgi:hypothetical protein